MREKMKSLVLTEANKLVLQECPIPVPGPTEVLIRVKAASICHTDFITLKGKYPGCKYPTVLGHEFSGIVERCGQSVTHVKTGDHVTSLGYTYCGTCSSCRRGLHNGCQHILGIPFHIDGAYQEMVCIPAVMVYSYNDSLSFAEASLTEPAANGYSAVERAKIYPGEDVVIIGPGPVGLLALQFALFKHPGSLIMVGTRDERLKIASRFGATETVNIREKDPYEAVMDITGNRGADVVLFCGGGKDAWEIAGRLLRQYGRVVVEALPETDDTEWPVRVFDFTAKHISYLGVGGYTGAQFEKTLRLIEMGKIDVESLITHRFSLDRYQEAFETSEKRKGGAIKVLFEMD